MIACEPTERLLVVSVALPPLSVAEPSVVVPSMKVTVPVVVPLPGAAAVTVAVNVTDWPNTEGFAEAVTTVLVLSWFTVWFSVGEVLMAKVALPLKTAVIACWPAASFVVISVALPPLSVAEPSLVVPSMKVTVPVTVPLPGATAETVAVKLTDWPKTDGLGVETTLVAELSGVTVCVRARCGAGGEVGVTAVARCDGVSTQFQRADRLAGGVAVDERDG